MDQKSRQARLFDLIRDIIGVQELVIQKYAVVTPLSKYLQLILLFEKYVSGVIKDIIRDN
jgi:hypothetical protein